MINITVAGLKSRGVYQIGNEEPLRSLCGETHPIEVKKCWSALEHHCREYISRSPFLFLSTQHSDGTADASPHSDLAGFVHVIDQHTVAIPDRPGNNQLDSLSNIISNLSA